MEWTAEPTKDTKCKYCKNNAITVVGVGNEFVAICGGCEEIECIFCEKMFPSRDEHEVCSECREKNGYDTN